MYLVMPHAHARIFLYVIQLESMLFLIQFNIGYVLFRKQNKIHVEEKIILFENKLCNAPKIKTIRYV